MSRDLSKTPLTQDASLFGPLNRDISCCFFEQDSNQETFFEEKSLIHRGCISSLQCKTVNTSSSLRVELLLT